LGKLHYKLGVPFNSFIYSVEILEKLFEKNNFTDKEFFHKIKNFTSKGYLHSLIEKHKNLQKICQKAQFLKTGMNGREFR
jgi:hypothetical protein